ncbi:glycosyl transferase, group 2 family protein [Haemophilus pittmaniae]|uniref:Glycosyl transferase, group 2 family protein n=1 Tax=Haemophilus pittmaniae TaxID=249188 RepID=A0A377IYB5_9PAST|nr:glycosyltransferase family 2 protein [Haemophilus pittmaniae]STO92968.1 glycosyl transferase, group 2 family protein [Haemophilus pittmaniae]
MSKVIAIIPHYNHSATVGYVAQTLINQGLEVLIVDDGSTAEHRQALSNLNSIKGLHIHYRRQNGGKGAAMKSGFQLALRLGYTHALQVDADGQHNLADVPLMLQQVEKMPEVIVCGRPIYGDDAPKSRLYGRKITNFWNAVHTWSFDIKDGMCGFRIYPLASVDRLLQQQSLGDGMDFDIDIIIRAHWQQIPLKWVDTPVKYDKNGISHFKVGRDNLRISLLHTRLFFTMLGRLLQGKPL